MALTKYKLGDLITQRREKYNGENNLSILGVSREGFIKPKQKDADISKYNTFYKYDFVFNPARMEINSIALNTDYDKAICSSLYEIFYIKDTSIVLPEYLNLFIKRSEFARQCEFIGWGSAREYCRVNDISDIDINLPSLSVQQKYVDIYNAMLANQRCYERGLEDLKLVCDAYIEDLRRNVPAEQIGTYLKECNEKNTDLSVTLNQGVDVNMQFILAKREAADKESNKIVRKGQFAFNKVVKSNGTKLPIALRDGPDCIVSGSYQVFEVADKEHLLPEYLMLWMARPETQRLCGFNAWGSTRDVFPFDELCKLEFPIPNIKVQQYIVDIYIVYQLRKEINELLKQQIRDICPILIKGAVEEGGRL